MSRVAILSPGYPELPGGVTDHTARLVENWSASGARVQVFGEIPESVAALMDTIVSAATAALLIQYVPFLFGRRGLSTLPADLAATCQAVGTRVTTFVHEPWVPPTRLPWLALSPLHRRQLRRIISFSDSVVTAVPAWAKMLGPATKTVYVGSTLGDPPGTLQSEPHLTSPVVFSPFASGLRWDWIAAAAEAVGAGLVVLGSDRETAAAHPTVGRHAKSQWDYRGRLPADEVLQLLARARLVLAPFVDGMTGRRTSAMASLSVGSKLLSSTGHLFDPAFSAGPVVAAESKETFIRSAVELWHAGDGDSQRDRRVVWFREHLTASRIDADLLAIVTGVGLR